MPDSHSNSCPTTNSLCHTISDKSPNAGYVENGSNGQRATVIELSVRNHPGVMSHITGLFARRAFNLEAIVCAAVGDGSTSTMLLLVANEPRLAQVERQLEKLYDVLSVRHRPDMDAEFFGRCVEGT
jgi:acetolactate synthase-1/3 small subunit